MEFRKVVLFFVFMMSLPMTLQASAVSEHNKPPQFSLELYSEAVADFAAYIDDVYGISELPVKRIIFEGNDEHKYVRFEYYLPDSERLESLIWVDSRMAKSINATNKGKVIIDCLCGPEVLPAHNYESISEKDANITCPENDCKMSVYPLK